MELLHLACLLLASTSVIVNAQNNAVSDPPLNTYMNEDTASSTGTEDSFSQLSRPGQSYSYSNEDTASSTGTENSFSQLSRPGQSYSYSYGVPASSHQFSSGQPIRYSSTEEMGGANNMIGINGGSADNLVKGSGGPKNLMGNGGFYSFNGGPGGNQISYEGKGMGSLGGQGSVESNGFSQTGPPNGFQQPGPPKMGFGGNFEGAGQRYDEGHKHHHPHGPHPHPHHHPGGPHPHHHPGGPHPHHHPGGPHPHHHPGGPHPHHHPGGPHPPHDHPFHRNTMGGSNAMPGGPMPLLLPYMTPGFWVPSAPIFLHHPGFGQQLPQGYGGNFQSPSQMMGYGPGFMSEQRPKESGFQTLQMASAGFGPGIISKQRPNDGQMSFTSIGQRPQSLSQASGVGVNGGKPGVVINADGLQGLGVPKVNSGAAGLDGKMQVASITGGTPSGGVGTLSGGVGTSSGGVGTLSGSNVVPVNIQAEVKPDETKNNISILAEQPNVDVTNSVPLPSAEIKTNVPTSLGGGSTGIASMERDGIPDSLNYKDTNNEAGQVALNSNGGKATEMTQGVQGIGIAAIPNMMGGKANSNSVSLAEGSGIGSRQNGALGGGQTIGGSNRQAQIKLITMPAQRTQTIRIKTVGAPSLSMNEGSFGQGGETGFQFPSTPQEGQFFTQGNGNGGGMRQTQSSGGYSGGSNARFSNVNGRPKFQFYPNSFIVTPIKTKISPPREDMDENFSLEDMNGGGKSSLSSTPTGGDKTFPK